MSYNTSTNEITFAPTKTFVINHPIDSKKFLVHGCLEGPETGVYYRGKSKIEIDQENVTIVLPEYVDAFAYDYTVQITPIFTGSRLSVPHQVTEVENGIFTVFGQPGMFYWLVHAKRADLNVQPLRSDVSIHGYGPYKWIE